jgi:hypothetical protein
MLDAVASFVGKDLFWSVCKEMVKTRNHVMLHIKFFIMLDALASFVGPVVQGIEGFKSPQMGERVNKPSM